MQREVNTPRPDWIEKAESVGFTYHSFGKDLGGDGVYWDESVAYKFTLEEVEVVEEATRELHQLCLKTVDYICDNPSLMDHFQIPQKFRNYIIRSWKRGDPTVMGRFDLAYNPGKIDAPLMLEYNADTPTLVIETALVQWFWLQDVHPDKDQFNSLHEKLIDSYKNISSKMPSMAPLHFSSLNGTQSPFLSELTSNEEYNHTMYFMDLAKQAGINTNFCAIGSVGWDGHRLVDQYNRPIRFWSKLYPWEWLVSEKFGEHLLRDDMGIIEPVWKMLLSNKALLPIIYDLFKGHKNLLPATFDQSKAGQNYVAKPILSREGSNIDLVRAGQETLKTDGSYTSPKIYQEYVDLQRDDGKYVVIGSWIANDLPAGMILRENDGPIVVNTSKVVPHYFVE